MTAPERSRRIRTVSAAASTFAAMTGGMLLLAGLAAPASAATSTPEPRTTSRAAADGPRGSVPTGATCGGVLLDEVPVRLGDRSLGTLEVYYERGYNCVMVRYAPGARPQGQVVYMYAALQRCKASEPSAICRDEVTVEDQGAFSSYAGPVRVYAPGKCIRAEGRIVIGPAAPPSAAIGTPTAVGADSEPSSAGGETRAPEAGEPVLTAGKLVEGYAETRPRAAFCG